MDTSKALLELEVRYHIICLRSDAFRSWYVISHMSIISSIGQPACGWLTDTAVVHIFYCATHYVDCVKDQGIITWCISYAHLNNLLFVTTSVPWYRTFWQTNLFCRNFLHCGTEVIQSYIVLVCFFSMFIKFRKHNLFKLAGTGWASVKYWVTLSVVFLLHDMQLAKPDIQQVQMPCSQTKLIRICFPLFFL
jgi:hypothetical protein